MCAPIHPLHLPLLMCYILLQRRGHGTPRRLQSARSKLSIPLNPSWLLFRFHAHAVLVYAGTYAMASEA